MNCLVVDKPFYLHHHAFIESIAKKMLVGTHRALTEFGETKYGFKENAPVDYLLEWEEPEVKDDFDQNEGMSRYAKMQAAEAGAEGATSSPDEES